MATMIESESVSEGERINVVNGLLRKAFGRTFRGDLMDYDYIPLPVQQSLHFVAGGLKIPFFYRIAGHFSRDDGSELTILPKYREEARTYANLYETAFGQEATVVVDTKAINSACAGLPGL